MTPMGFPVLHHFRRHLDRPKRSHTLPAATSRSLVKGRGGGLRIFEDDETEPADKEHFSDRSKHDGCNHHAVDRRGTPKRATGSHPAPPGSHRTASGPELGRAGSSLRGPG